MSSQRSSSNGGPINSAPRMGGAAWTNAEISSESDCGRTRELGSGGSSSPHARATKDCPMSRQYDSVGWRSLPSSPAPRCRTPWPRPVPNALRIRCCVAADIVRSPIGQFGSDLNAPTWRQPTDECGVGVGDAVEGALCHFWNHGTRDQDVIARIFAYRPGCAGDCATISPPPSKMFLSLPSSATLDYHRSYTECRDRTIT